MKHSETPLSVNKQLRVKKKDIACCLPPPKNNDCSNGSQTTARDGRKYTWRVLVIWVHNFATCIEHWKHLFFSATLLFFLSHVVCFPIVPKLKGEKRGSRSRCVIKCNLNWMANEKVKAKLRSFLCEFPVDTHLMDILEVGCLNTASVLLIQTACSNVRLCMHQKKWSNFLTHQKGEKRKRGQANYMKCIIK